MNNLNAVLNPIISPIRRIYGYNYVKMFCNHQNIHVCHASNSNKQSMHTRFSRISGRNNTCHELNSVINQGNHEKLVISMLGLQNWRMFSSKKRLRKSSSCIIEETCPTKQHFSDDIRAAQNTHPKNVFILFYFIDYITSRDNSCIRI